jgi:N-methylhydantoinase A
MYTLAIDIGGTFTDIVLRNQTSGELFVAKVLTQYPDPSLGVMVGVRQIFQDAKLNPKEVMRVIHGTTLVTNTLIERKGAKTALITTEGFRDALEIGREGRYDIYDLFLKLPLPLVPRQLRFEVRERLFARGEVMDALREEDVVDVCEKLKKLQVEAVGIVFLHAYVNPAHERLAAQIVKDKLPHISLSVSHEVAAELREYERTSTTLANAYVQPLVAKYLNRLEQELQGFGIGAPLHVMLSNGGSCAVDTACRFPVRLVESGPCGGALAAAHAGEKVNEDKILAFDMGGTTAKAILSESGYFPITTESEVARVYRFKRGSGLPLLVPVLDMIEIGAGGGSIAHVNALGLPAVGPESAGSQPGPVCYGRGGEAPTVTDADLILGYLNASHFLGGEMVLDVAQTEGAIDELANQLELTQIEMALGIHDLVNENMANAARVHAAERGKDLDGYALVATGGAGPVHACGVAKRLGVNRVIVPPVAGVGSAFGLMLAPIAFDYARSYVTRLEMLDVKRVNGLYDEMEQEGMAVLAKAHVEADEVRLMRSADMRYVGQGHEIRVEIPNGHLGPLAIVRVQKAFDEAYARLYGRVCEGVPVEVIHWRVTVSGPKPVLGEGQKIKEERPDSTALKGVRWVIFDAKEGAVSVPVYDRYNLQDGFALGGPLIVEENESTTVVPPDWSMDVAHGGYLVLSREGV